MRVGVLLPLVIFAGLPVAQSSVYLLSDVHVGKGFLHGFEHQAIVDPTQGRVYVLRLYRRPHANPTQLQKLRR